VGVEEEELEEEGRGIEVGEKVEGEADEEADVGEATEGSAGEDIKGLMVAVAPATEGEEEPEGLVPAGPPEAGDTGLLPADPFKIKGGEARVGLLGIVPLSWAVGLGMLAVPLVPGMRAEALLGVGAGAKLPPFTDWLESEAVGAVAPVLMSGTVTVGGDSSAPAEGASSVGDPSGAAPGLRATRSLVGTLTVSRFDGGDVPLTRPCRTERAIRRVLFRPGHTKVRFCFCQVDTCCRQML